ncbi:Pre-mRNA-splicing factor 38 domain-containing protein [Paramicrosporidium saccamoebae]|uniref:Pre-mRNA-splicing factor 38 n=1 Tax=Paramicrosporidium saccamoebae TaxID=1246581 RepID=A0A2H9TID3_9FUNG|nr:Pre-mRNA-splicing factor 38 domain-containing protein [Paramicrosporidium saccamoebae]
MSNKTDKGAQTVHGRDPQLLVEKIIRERIYESVFWKEECFGLNAETILDKAVELNYVGGTFANQRPVPFLCLLLKLLQIQPTMPIVEEYIQQEDWKYLRLLGLFYLRLVAPSVQVYTKLEPFLADRRKIRSRQTSGTYTLAHVDEVVDEMLTQDRVFGIILPRLPKRTALEDTEELPMRSLFFPVDAASGNAIQIDEEAPTEYRESLSIEETNQLRQRLGLAPLT